MKFTTYETPILSTTGHLAIAPVRQSDTSTVIQNADGSWTVPAGYFGKLPDITNTTTHAAVLLDAAPIDGTPDR